MDKKEANSKIKELEKQLEELKEIVNKPEDLFSIVKNYSDVCRLLGEKELSVGDLCDIPQEYRVRLIAVTRIQQIQKLFNGGWKPNWSDINQRKWYPYFETNSSSGFRFCRSVARYDFFYGEVGFYKDQQTADFVGKTFIDLYKQLL